MSYLIKVTIIWTVLLLLFELFYKGSGKYLANRIYLLLSLAAGLLLPLVSIPAGLSNIPIYHAVEIKQTSILPAVTQHPTIVQVSGYSAYYNMRDIAMIAYLMVFGVLLLISLHEVWKIMRAASKNKVIIIEGKKVFQTNGKHPPYSFMGWIFLNTNLDHTNEELSYMVRHEDAHNAKRHWIDLLLMQLVCIVCWFHPLVWRYRYLLKLQHEFEADDIASGNDAYSYGHFLLSETLLKGSPSIAHSFHFSPIKTRITMLTKKKNTRMFNWKYLLTIPAVVCCTLLMAQSKSKDERVKIGNVTKFRGNEFRWDARQIEMIGSKDPETGVTKTILFPDSAIVSMNDEVVLQPREATTAAVFNAGNLDFDQYLERKFKEHFKVLPDSIAQLQVNKIVLNKQGKIVYYELTILNEHPNFKESLNQHNPAVVAVMDQIVNESPAWTPAIKDGEPVNCFEYHHGFTVRTVSFTFRTKG